MTFFSSARNLVRVSFCVAVFVSGFVFAALVMFWQVVADFPKVLPPVDPILSTESEESLPAAEWARPAGLEPEEGGVGDEQDANRTVRAGGHVVPAGDGLPRVLPAHPGPTLGHR